MSALPGSDPLVRAHWVFQVYPSRIGLIGAPHRLALSIAQRCRAPHHLVWCMHQKNLAHTACQGSGARSMNQSVAPLLNEAWLTTWMHATS